MSGLQILGLLFATVAYATFSGVAIHVFGKVLEVDVTGPGFGKVIYHGFSLFLGAMFVLLMRELFPIWQ